MHALHTHVVTRCIVVDGIAYIHPITISVCIAYTRDYNPLTTSLYSIAYADGFGTTYPSTHIIRTQWWLVCMYNECYSNELVRCVGDVLTLFPSSSRHPSSPLFLSSHLSLYVTPLRLLLRFPSLIIRTLLADLSPSNRPLSSHITPPYHIYERATVQCTRYTIQRISLCTLLYQGPWYYHRCMHVD